MADPSPDAPWIRAPRQARSRQTSDRIADAVTELLAEKPFEAISIPEVAARAGISVGGFYSRFPSKDAVLLHLFDDRFFSGYRAEADAVLSPDRWAGQPAAPIVAEYVRMMVALFRGHAPLLRQIARLNRAGMDATFRERVLDFNRHVHEQLRALLLARRGEIAHPDADVAIDLAILGVGSTAREMILHGSHWPYVTPAAHHALAAELTRMFSAYLGLPPAHHER